MAAKKVSKARGFVPMVEVRRGNVVESLHFGALALVDDEGRRVAAVGDPSVPVVLRSTAKPAQVLPLIDSGAADRFRFDDRQIAVMIGSHGGEPFHVRAVRSILRRIGLDETALRCGAHAPYHRPSALALRRRGSPPGALHNNCSGKHAGMLALAVHLGAPIGTYLDPAHPVQALIRARLERLAGLRPGEAQLLVDGCSAPTFALPLEGLALLYARLAAGGRRSRKGEAAIARAVTAMRRHPEMVAGSGRLCTALMQSCRAGLLAKIGAEGMYGLAWESGRGGRGMAIKIADGEGERSRYSAVLEALRQLGLLEKGRAQALRARFVGEIRNHRRLVVGNVAATFRLPIGML